MNPVRDQELMKNLVIKGVEMNNAPAESAHKEGVLSLTG